MKKLLALLALSAPSLWASCTGSSPNWSATNDPTSVQTCATSSVDGDTITIASGSATWSSGVTVPSGKGITIRGTGTPNSGASTTGVSSSCGTGTTITDNISGAAVFSFAPQFGNSPSRLSCIHMSPGTGTAQPVIFNGTCTSSGCASVRIDNLTVPEGWAGIGISDDNFAIVNNVFGVADHNTVGGASIVDNGVDFLNVGFGAWQGTGFWGDNSWATADTFGASQVFYLENNSFNNSFGTDMDYYPGDGDFGGGRAACRFNTFTNLSPATACTDHGTDTIGRVRGGRQIEFYQNLVGCPGGGCGAVFGDRSSTSIVWGNQITSGATSAYVSVDTQRRWRTDSPWGPCDGSGAFDTNDGTTYYSGTISSQSLSGNTYTINVSGTPWTVNEWNPSPAGSPYSFHDLSTSPLFGFEIASGTTTSSSFKSYTSCAGNGCSDAPSNGNNFQILRATVCMDQAGRGAGLLVQGGDCNTFPTSGHLCPQLVATGNPGSVAEALDPSYETDDAGTVNNAQYASNDSQSLLANRDWYSQTIGQGVQTSSTSPFNGTSGTGWGTLANRPSSCTAGVGYLATDQGSWNTSGGTNPASYSGQGTLYTCNSGGNAWTAHYQPYTYPHPLDGGSTPTPPNAQSTPSLTATIF